MPSYTLVPREIRQATAELMRGELAGVRLAQLVREGGPAAARAYVLGQVEVLDQLVKVQAELDRMREQLGKGGRKPTSAAIIAQTHATYEKIDAEHPKWCKERKIRETCYRLGVKDPRTVEARLRKSGARPAKKQRHPPVPISFGIAWATPLARWTALGGAIR